MTTVIVRGEIPDVLENIPSKNPPFLGARVRVVRAGRGLAKSDERFLGMGLVTKVTKNSYSVSTVRMVKVDLGDL